MKKLLLGTILVLSSILNIQAIGFEWYGLSNSSGNYIVNDLVYHDNHIFGVGEFESASIVIGGIILTNSAIGSSDIFVFKADTLGTVIWAAKFGGTGDEKSDNMSVDNAGNPLITGSYEGSGVFGTNTIASNGGKDVFVLKLNNNGAVNWVTSIGGTLDDIGNDVCSDYSNNVYFVSTLKSAVTFPNVTSVASNTTYPGIGKLDNLGNKVWLKFTNGQASTIQNDFGTSIKYNSMDSSILALTTIRSQDWRMYDNNNFPAYSFFASPGKSVYFEFQTDSTLINLNGYSYTALTGAFSRDAAICDSSLFTTSDVNLNVAGSANSYIEKRKIGVWGTTQYQFYDPIPIPNGPGFISIPKLSCTDGELYAIQQYTNINASCPNSNISDIIHHSIPSSTFDSLDIPSFFNLPINSLASKNQSVYIGGNGYVAKVCQSNTCPISSVANPLILNPALDVTKCSSSNIPIGRNLCDYVISGTPPYTFSWTPSTSLSANNIPNPITTTSLNQTYYLVVTDALNNIAYDTVDVSVTNGLISNFTFTASADTICSGDTIQFNASYTGNPTWFNWSKTTGNTAYNSVFSFINTDSVSAMGATNATSWFPPNQLYQNTISFSMHDSLGCQYWDTAQITILPSNVNIAISPAPPICASDSLTLTATGLNAIQWQAGIQNGVPFLTNINSNNYNIYNVSGIDPTTGCAINHDTIVYNLPPTIVANSSNNQNPVQVCQGAQVQLYGSGGNPPYTWSGGIQDNVPFNANASQYYSVSAIDQNNCLSSDSILVTFLPSTIVVNQNPSNVCPGTQVVLSATGGIPPYTWNGGVINNVPFVPNNQYYVVSANDLNGCYSSDSVLISLLPTPNIVANSSINQNPASICLGDSILAYGSGGLTYYWSGGISDSVSFTTNTSQSYILYGTDSNNCIGKDTFEVIVHPLPTPSISFNGTSLNCTGVTNITIYNWFLAGNSFGGNTAVQTITQNGTYVVEAIDSNGCSGFDTLQVVNLYTGNISAESNHISLYPNPSSGKFTIQSDLMINGQIEVYDILGKRIKTFEMNKKSLEFDLSNQAKGDYIIRVITKDYSCISKLSLQ